MSVFYDKGLLSSKVNRGYTVTNDAENSLLSFEEWGVSPTQEAINLAWILWFRSFYNRSKR